MEEENSEIEQVDLNLKAFDVPGEDDNHQIILAHKQIGSDHYVFTHGMKETDKLRCFKLSQSEKSNSFKITEYVNAHDVANVARLMELDKPIQKMESTKNID